MLEVQKRLRKIKKYKHHFKNGEKVILTIKENLISTVLNCKSYSTINGEEVFYYGNSPKPFKNGYYTISAIIKHDYLNGKNITRIMKIKIIKNFIVTEKKEIKINNKYYTIISTIKHDYLNGKKILNIKIL